MSERGAVTAGVQTGNVLIRINDTSSDAVATATFSIVPLRIDALDVAPGPAVPMRAGEVRRFSATARLSNGVIKDVTTQEV